VQRALNRAKVRAAKALELFIRDLVVDASAKAQEKGAKKLSPYHVCVLSSSGIIFAAPGLMARMPLGCSRFRPLTTPSKRAVLEKDAYAFVKPLVEDIPDPIEADEGEAKPKRKRKAKEPAADGEGGAPVAKKPRQKKAPAEGKPEAPVAAPAAAVADDDEGAGVEAEAAAPAAEAAEERIADADEDYD